MTDELQGYCMKCKTKQPFGQDAEYVEYQTTRGTKAQHQGKCPKCGTKMCKIVKRKSE